MTSMINVDTMVRFGTVAYERGLEVVELHGYLQLFGSDWLLVYGNGELPGPGQRNTAIPVHRVIEIDSELIAEP